MSSPIRLIPVAFLTLIIFKICGIFNIKQDAMVIMLKKSQNKWRKLKSSFKATIVDCNTIFH